MSTRVIVLFNLKPGVTVEEYESFARQRDLPIVKSLSSIEAFEIFRCNEQLGGGKSPYNYIEVIDIADMEQFGADIATEAMREVASAFGNLAEAVFIKTARLL